MKVPDRIKLVTWRLYYNALPVFSKLSKMGCNTGNVCVFCGFKVEDAKHLFVNCWWSNYFWVAMGLNDLVWKHTWNWTIADWVWSIITEKDPRIIRLAITGIWVICYLD